MTLSRSVGGPPEREHIVTDPLICYEFQTFWISWSDGHIMLGSGSFVHSATWIQFDDPSPYAVAAVSFTTVNATGVWRIGQILSE